MIVICNDIHCHQQWQEQPADFLLCCRLGATNQPQQGSPACRLATAVMRQQARWDGRAGE